MWYLCNKINFFLHPIGDEPEEIPASRPEQISTSLPLTSQGSLPSTSQEIPMTTNHATSNISSQQYGKDFNFWGNLTSLTRVRH